MLPEKPSNLDLQFIEEQLGRKPRGVLEVSARCKSGHPSVIKTKPLLDKEIFPTLYYLVCGKLIKKVFKLESEGLIDKLEQKINNDKKFKALFLKAQEDYIKKRNKIAVNQMKELCRAGSPNTPLPKTGIGGVGKLDKIKCLHAHLAHYLATGNNPVGEIVRARLDSFPGNCP